MGRKYVEISEPCTSFYGYESFRGRIFVIPKLMFTTHHGFASSVHPHKLETKSKICLREEPKKFAAHVMNPKY